MKSKHRRSGWGRILVVGLLFSVFGLGAPAVNMTGFGTYEQAPVLVAGKVVSIELGRVVSMPEISKDFEVLECTAVVSVLRSHALEGALAPPAPETLVRIRFFSLPAGTVTRNTSSLPSIKVAEVLVFPLRSFEEVWRLRYDYAASVPRLRATTDTLADADDATDSRDFLLNEIASVFVNGTPQEVEDLAQSLRLHFFRNDSTVVVEILSRINAATRADRGRQEMLEALYRRYPDLLGQ